MAERPRLTLRIVTPPAHRGEYVIVPHSVVQLKFDVPSNAGRSASGAVTIEKSSLGLALMRSSSWPTWPKASTSSSCLPARTLRDTPPRLPVYPRPTADPTGGPFGGGASPPSVPPHFAKASENRSRSAGAKQACEKWTLTLARSMKFPVIPKRFPVIAAKIPCSLA